MKEGIPVGIYNGEIYIADTEHDGTVRRGCDGRICFTTLRPVSADALENLRNPDARREEYKDFWKEAVKSGATEEGFEEWLDGVWEDEFDEDDEEDYPGKDPSGVDVLSEEERKAADAFLESQGMDVATWECAGGYPPTFACYDSRDGEWRNRFVRWDYVFDSSEACRLLADEVVRYNK